MSSLSHTDQERILDYCLGQLSEQQAADVETLIKSNPKADHLFRGICISLRPLSMADLLEPCPDALAERTVARLLEKARPETNRLQELIADEQTRAATIKIPLWHRVTQIAAVAAVVIFGLSVAIPALRHARLQAYQKHCAAQLSAIGQGMMKYQNDNGQMPAITLASGSPWWQVGYQGEENHSNTRSVWLLASQGYVNPERFICPGRLQEMGELEFDNMAVSQLRDFPDKKYMNYSPRVCCSEGGTSIHPETILMADNNPMCDILYERVPTDYTRGFKFNVRLDENLLSINSRNHGGQGQNILTGNGAVTFITSRTLGANHDDIYALNDMRQGLELSGCELPSCATDTFLAP
jgi:hypothetical protein